MWSKEVAGSGREEIEASKQKAVTFISSIYSTGSLETILITSPHVLSRHTDQSGLLAGHIDFLKLQCNRSQSGSGL